MQRDAISLNDLAARDNVLLAVWKAARAKRARPAVLRFLADLDARIDALARDIVGERAPLGRFRRFTIHDPKRRVITAACFADRVLHHAILNLAEPRFERMLVDSCFACRPGKGVHAAALVVQRNLQRWPWFVQVDVDGYFPSIDHAVLKTLLARRFKGEGFLALLGRIIDDGAGDTAGRGLPIGALTSQHFANAYLDAADRMLLAHQDVRAHVRYMDDIVWWCPTRAAALASLAQLSAFLWHERRLRLKPAVRIGSSSEGLAYCGYRIRPGLVLASSRKLSRYRAGLARIEDAQSNGLASAIEIQRSHDAMLAALNGAETLGFRQRMQHATVLAARHRCRQVDVRVPCRSRMQVDMKAGAPRPARRLLERQRQEGAFSLPQRESPGQREPQPGLSPLPELDGTRAVDAVRGMDQTVRPDRCGGCRAGEPQGARGAGRLDRGEIMPNAPRVAAFALTSRTSGV